MQRKKTVGVVQIPNLGAIVTDQLLLGAKFGHRPSPESEAERRGNYRFGARGNARTDRAASA